MDRIELTAYLDGLLDAGRFRDYCPNGLQVEGRERIRRIVCGVTASQALIEVYTAAIAGLLQKQIGDKVAMAITTGMLCVSAVLSVLPSVRRQICARSSKPGSS
mgnify:CR=1 FL=1